MNLPVIVLCTVCIFLVTCCESRKLSHRRKIPSALLHGNVSSTAASQENATSGPKNRSRLYSSWSPWSKCSRRCNQVRTRHCKITSECGTSILREEKACFRDRCKRRQVKDKLGMLEEALNRKDPSSNSEFRILYHLLQPSPYSEWTQWSPCSRNCLTHRTRKCLLPDLCGQKMFHESALCYVDDSACERLYSKKRKKKKSSTEITNEGPKIHPLNGLKCGLTPKTPDLRSLLRIIGGREASRGSWPWQVTILNKYREPFCGGTLLSQGWVLTAAHCVRKRLVIRAGEHDLMSDEGTEQESRVLDSFVHPDYDMNTVNNDVALLKLKHPFTFNQFAQPACLPSPSDELEIHSRAVILGWGKRKNSAVYGTDHLHQAEVPVVDLQDCRENYQNYHISSNMLCAGFKEGRVDSCAGDSGGPLLFQKDNKWTIFGITSFGEGCGQKGKYGIYANVPKFVKWIRKTIMKHS